MDKENLINSENKHFLDEKEWQDYCAFKLLEPQIEFCLDREREYVKKLAEKDEQIEDLIECNKYLQIYRNKDKILFAVVLLKKLKELFLIQCKEYPIVYNISDDIVGGAFDRDKCFDIIDNEIEILKRMVSK